jgi:hypothetical protein
MNWGADGEVNGRVVRLAPTLQPPRRRAVRPHITLAGNQRMPLKLFLPLLVFLLFWLLQIHRKLLARHRDGVGPKSRARFHLRICLLIVIVLRIFQATARASRLSRASCASIVVVEDEVSSRF